MEEIPPFNKKYLLDQYHYYTKKLHAAQGGAAPCAEAANLTGKMKWVFAYALLFQKGGTAREKEWAGIDRPLFFRGRRGKFAGIDLTIPADFYREKSPEWHGSMTL